METNEEQRITNHLAAIEPEWHPDPVRARDVLNARLHTPTPFWTWRMTAAAALICLAVAAFPQTRAMAQDIWKHFVVSHVDIVRLDLSNLPLQSHITTNGTQQHARDLDETEQMAGFRPNLPAGVLSAVPSLTVTGPIVLDQTIRIHDLEAALVKEGATDVRVAPEWEGVTLHAVIGPMVAADYPGEVQILQIRPFSLTMPSGFSLERFAEAAFRSIGVNSRDAAAMARKFAANPAMLFDIPPDEVVSVQELSLVNGPAMLTEEYDEDTHAIARETVIRSTTDRIYAVMSPSRDLCIKIASALP